VRSFTVGTARGTDEADGIDATTATLGPRYPLGPFVAQDGRNDGGDRNFKLVRCRDARGGAWRRLTPRRSVGSPAARRCR
jgi:myo-inositol-hexaphosphate 3-phosphohydrolase